MKERSNESKLKALNEKIEKNDKLISKLAEENAELSLQKYRLEQDIKAASKK